jgi:hypothetical protein
VLVHGPEHTLGLAPLHRGGELGLFFRQAEAKDGVRHFRVSRIWKVARLGCQPGDVIGI